MIKYILTVENVLHDDIQSCDDGFGLYVSTPRVPGRNKLKTTAKKIV